MSESDPSTPVPLRLAGREVAGYLVDPAVHRLHGPRPYLHPIRTLGGTVVSDAAPADHPWHLGASLGMQDVDGTNLWGGRTYVRGLGYTWLGDHGRIEHAEWLSRADDALSHRLRWVDPADRTQLVEERSLRASTLAGRSDAWLLDISYELTVAHGAQVSLGSPATNGRPDGAGYGGFFWRAASAGTPVVFSASTDDEDKVNGSTEPWVAMVLTDPAGARATLVFTGLGAGDAWFVRAAQYPGVCVALAYEQRRVIRAGEPLRRRHRIAVVDGTLDRAAVGALLAGFPA